MSRLRKYASRRTADTVEAVVAMSVDTTMFSGLADPKEVLRAIMVLGTKVTFEVFIARNVHIGREAALGVGLSFCNSFMALSPKGVAALPNPNKLAVRFIVM